LEGVSDVTGGRDVEAVRPAMGRTPARPACADSADSVPIAFAIGALFEGGLAEIGFA
jgi:hypothetical protein